MFDYDAIFKKKLIRYNKNYFHGNWNNLNKKS